MQNFFQWCGVVAGLHVRLLQMLNFKWVPPRIRPMAASG
jgi:hypothetical protein